MDCENAARLMQDYLDHVLPDSAARAIERHIESCEECAREFRLLTRLDLALRSQSMEEPPADLAAAVRGRLPRRVACSWRDVAMAAASIAVVVGLFWLYEQGGVSALADGGPAQGLAQFLHLFEGEDAAFDLSLSEICASASEDYAVVRGRLEEVCSATAAGRMIVFLIASALLAVGTNAACFHRARVRHWTTTHS